LLSDFPHDFENPSEQHLLRSPKNPLGCSEANDYDDTGRILNIAIVGDFALMYWIDDTDSHVKILDIHAADR
jgi:hypothetical protein